MIDNKRQVSQCFTPFDLKRLESYTNNLLDYHVILDLASTLAHHYFLGRYNADECSGIKPVRLSPVQAAIILGVGLQKKSFNDLETELELPTSQILALFGKTVKKCVVYLSEVVEIDAKMQVEQENAVVEKTAMEGKRRNPENDEEWDPTLTNLDDDLQEGSEEWIAMQERKSRQKELVGSWDLSSYVIGGTDEDWEKVKVGAVSGIANIPNAASTKKRKLVSTAADLASKSSGESNGIVDPRNLLKLKKKGDKKRKRK